MGYKACLLLAILSVVVGISTSNVLPESEARRLQARGWFDNIIGGAKDAVSGVTNGAKDAVSGITNGAKDVVSGVTNGAKDAVNNVKDNVDKVVDQTQGVIDKVTEEAKESIKGATSLIDALKSLNVCSCKAGVCQCCADLKLTKNKVCFALTFKPEEFAVEYGLLLNEKSLMKGSVSGKNPGAVCAPLPPFPAVSFCFRPYDLSISSEGFQACFQVEAKALGKVIASVAFNCFRFKGNTINLLPPTQPTDQGFVNLNVSKIVSPIIDVSKPIKLPISLPSLGLFS